MKNTTTYVWDLLLLLALYLPLSFIQPSRVSPADAATYPNAL